jgi:DNA-binding transcriptional LysR family regulator
MADGLQPREYKHSQTRYLKRACGLELRQLRAFVALIDEGSVTAAASALKLAQSTVSESLAALERTLGTSVVRRHRGTHESVLTPAGQALLPNARDLLAGVEKTCIAVAEAAVKARGAVNIVANESVSTYVLPKVLAPLRARWPNTQFSVSVATCASVRRGIEDGTFDLGVILQEAKQPAQAGPKVGRYWQEHEILAPVIPLIIFAAEAHPLARRKLPEQTRRSELMGFLMFVSDPAGEFHELITNFLLEDGVPTARIQSAGSIEGVKRGVTGDPHALGILPAYAIREELRAGRFVRLGVTPTPPAMQLVALLSGVQHRHPGAIELVNGIRTMFTVRAQPA